MTGAANQSYTTGSNGYYEFLSLTTGSYTVTPSKFGWKSSPTSKSYAPLSADQLNQDYTGQVFITFKNGYLWDESKSDYWIPHGIAYQTWNHPLGMNQTFDQIDYDLDEMVKANVNSVRVDFVWKQIEAAGDNQFDWTNYDYFVQAAAQRGLRIFALIGYQWPPDWFQQNWYTMHPPGNDNEGVYQPARWKSDIISYENTSARAKYTAFLSAVANRYKDNPTIVGWIVGNEYGYLGLWSTKQDGYDPDCEGAFRNWLTAKYVTIAALNQVWGTTYASFAAVIMPEYYTRDKHCDTSKWPADDPNGTPSGNPNPAVYNPGAWWDLVQWREDSIASFTSIGAQAVRNADPNHLISYATVGTQWGEEDWRYHAEDPTKIAKACKDIGSPLDFWSINNYPWYLPGSESITARYGVIKAKWRVGLPVLYTETGFTSSETFPVPGFINEQNQGPLIRNSLWEALEAGAIGVHVFTWNDRAYITDREKGFGIVYADRRIKPSFWVVRDTYNLMDQVGVTHLIGNSKDATRDVAFLWSDATDDMYNRYEANMQHLFAPLQRVGYEPTFLSREELLTSKYFKDIWQSDPVVNLATVHAGTRSLKINTGNGGGTIAVYPANSAQVMDLNSATGFSLWVYDTQGNNSIQLRLRDVNGNGGSGNDGYYLWSSNASVQNQWTQISWNMTQYPSVPNLDKTKIASVELYEWNQGVYYLDDATYTAGSQTAFQNFEKNNGTPLDYSSYAAIILPRNMRMYPGDLTYIRTKVIPAGVNIYADADLPGMQDYHVNTLGDFATEVGNIFGINAADTSGYDDPVRNEQYGINFVPINTTVTQALSPLTVARQDTFHVWKYSNMTVATTGTVYATHSNGNPALVIKDNGTSKAAITTFGMGDMNTDGNGDGQPDIIPWAQHFDWMKAIFLTGFGIQPAVNISGSQYVVVDYRTAADGSILISARNYRQDQNETVTITTPLIAGMTIENLTTGGVIAQNSNGTFNLTLGPIDHELIKAYVGAPSPKAAILDAPAVVHPMGDKSYQVNVRYDTLGAQNLTLYVALQKAGAPNTVYSSTNVNVTGAGDQTLWLWIPDANKADAGYMSTPDGGSYVIHAWLEQSSVKVAESYQNTQLEWGADPTTPFPTSLSKGQNYSLNFKWQDLYEYQSWENTPLKRETDFPGRIAVVRSAKTQALYSTHYDKVNQVCDWLESLGYVHSNPAVTHFDDVLVTSGGNTLFSDNFSSGNANNWTVVEGSSRWTVPSYEYSIDRMSQSYNISVAGSSSWTDYSAEMKFKYVTQDPYFEEAYLVFRYQDNDNFYYVKPYNNYGLWRLKYGGRVNGQEFGGNIVNLSNAISANVFHTLKVVATGGNFQVYLDGQLEGQFSDNNLATGKIGVGAKASQLGVSEPLLGYYFVDDNERGLDGNLLNLDWGYLKEFFPIVVLPSVYVMNDDECYGIKSYLQAGQFTVLATDGGVGIKQPDGSSGTGRIETAFGVDSGYTTLANLQNLQVTDNTHYITKDYTNGQNIATASGASAISWTTVTTGTKIADIKNATSSAPALISNLLTKDSVSFQNFETGNSTHGAYYYDAWQSNPAFETTIKHGGARSVKMVSGSGGGTIGINIAAPIGYIDLTSMTDFHVWVYDTQGNNTLQIKFKDKWGNLSSALWSTMSTAQNQWTLISWPISQTQGIDLGRVASIELYEWNQGTYYFDDAYFVTSDIGEKKGKTFVFNYGVDTSNQMTNQFSVVSQNTFDWMTKEIYKMKVLLKYETPDTTDSDLVLAEKDVWTTNPTGTMNVQFTLPQTTMTGDGSVYWVVYAYPWNSADPWTDQMGFYTSLNDPGYQSSISGYGLYNAGATFIATGGRTFDNWIAYNTRGDNLKLNFGFGGDGNNGDGLTNEIYGGSPMFDGKSDPNSWLTETTTTWVSNANTSGTRPQVFMTLKDIVSATSPTLTMNFNFAGAWDQLTVDKSADRTTWTNIYTSGTSAGNYNPAINLDTACKYYRVTLTDGDLATDIITLQKKMTLAGYPSATLFRLEDWLQTQSVNGLVDDFRSPYTPFYALVPDYDPAHTELKDSASGGKYNWVTWFSETSDKYDIPTTLYWAPRLKVEDPNFPTTFNPGTTVNVPVVWEGLDTIVTITAWKPYAVTFPLTLRVFLQDVYTGTTYVTSDFTITTGSGDQSFAINVPSNTPYGSNYMWGAYIFDNKRQGVQPYEERIGMDDTFRFTATGQPYEPETTISVGTAYSVYSDSGIPQGSSIYTWGYGTWDGNYSGGTPPEGTLCFQTISTWWAGWGVFHTSGTVDLSAYANGYLKFWVKSSTSLTVEIEAPAGNTYTQYIPSSGGSWQEVSIPISNFSGANLTQVYCPLKITAASATTFYVDSVRWSH